MKQLLLLTSILMLLCAEVEAQIFRVAQMHTEQIKALDRSRTVVLLPGGILEQHGPHLQTFRSAAT